MSIALINELLKSKLQENPDTSLIMYRLPSDDKVNIIVGNAQKLNFKEALSTQTGFLFSPATNSQVHHTYAVSVIKHWQLENAHQIDLNWYQWPISAIEPFITSQHDYLSQALGMVWAMKDKQLKKAILSRILKHPMNEFDPIATFNRLCDKYTSVMVYIVAIPNVGTWIGATPETLVSIANGQAHTMALAGTQKDAGLPFSDVAWGSKEQEEQQIVADNIEQLIKTHFPAASIKMDGPQTVSTGALLHLNTSFQWNIDGNSESLASFIDDLHPTPAIVGEPREAAMKLIADTEPHDRAYYTGLLGPLNNDGITHLFVNLRCMQVFDGYVALYVGGGLTANSNPNDEWNETKLKAKTLLQVL